jgi:pimeloyl-ACP methyl ester carboxylesterase
MPGRAAVQETFTSRGQALAVRRLAPRTPAGATAPPGGDEPPPVVLLHGLGQSSTDWLPVLPELDGRLEPWAPDLPGHGRSPVSVRGDYTPAAHARAVADFVEEHVRQPVHLAGNSLGGLVALLIATRRPHLVRTLTLVSPALPARFPSRDGLALLLLSTPGVGERLVRSGSRRPPERRARDLLSLVFADPHAVGEPDLALLAEELAERGALPHADPAFLASLRGLVRVHLLQSRRTWGGARGVTVPTLVLYGGRDRLVSARSARRARRMFAGGRIEVDPDGGHIPQREHPQLVAQALVRHALVHGSRPQDVAGSAGRREVQEAS